MGIPGTWETGRARIAVEAGWPESRPQPGCAENCRIVDLDQLGYSRDRAGWKGGLGVAGMGEGVERRGRHLDLATSGTRGRTSPVLRRLT